MLDIAPKSLNDNLAEIAASTVKTDASSGRFKSCRKRFESKPFSSVVVEYQ